MNPDNLSRDRGGEGVAEWAQSDLLYRFLYIRASLSKSAIWSACITLIRSVCININRSVIRSVCINMIKSMIRIVFINIKECDKKCV